MKRLICLLLFVVLSLFVFTAAGSAQLATSSNPAPAASSQGSEQQTECASVASDGT